MHPCSFSNGGTINLILTLTLTSGQTVNCKRTCAAHFQNRVLCRARCCFVQPGYGTWFGTFATAKAVRSAQYKSTYLLKRNYDSINSYGHKHSWIKVFLLVFPTKCSVWPLEKFSHPCISAKSSCLLWYLLVKPFVLLVFSERELKFMFAICRRPSVCRLSVCLSSVCNVRAPYSDD